MRTFIENLALIIIGLGAGGIVAGGVVAFIVMLVSLLQLLKELLPIFVTPFPIVTSVRAKQSWKAYSSMVITLFGMVTFVSLMHL